MKNEKHVIRTIFNHFVKSKKIYMQNSQKRSKVHNSKEPLLPFTLTLIIFKDFKFKNKFKYQ